jgi:probable F420-dependent oxidoreductase
MSGLWHERIGSFGIWRPAGQTSPELAANLEALGFGALWLGGSPSGDLALVDQLLDETTTLVIATGIVNVWRSAAEQVAASFARIEGRHPGRFLLGVGAGHPEATAGYVQPYDTIVRYVDALIANGVPPQSMVLAALGPRMLRLAADRTAGAHPYLVPADYTRQAREILGAEPLLAPEHKAVIDTDPQTARAIGRPRVRTPYLGLVNYTSNLRRLGWTDADMADGGSDALIDALVAHGSPEQVAAGLNAHLTAGADHVCVQLFSATGAGTLEDYGKLAAGLGLAAGR